MSLISHWVLLMYILLLQCILVIFPISVSSFLCCICCGTIQLKVNSDTRHEKTVGV